MKVHDSGDEMTADELIARIEADEAIHVLDVRAPARLASGRIDAVPPDRFHNVPGSVLSAAADPAEFGLPRGTPIAVVCGHGQDSRIIADALRKGGFEARSLSGGMAAWMGTCVERELPAPSGWDRFIQLDRVGKGALGYLLASGGEALIVDPSRHVSDLLDLVATNDLTIVGVADSHAHADYISGGPDLARRLGVPYYLHPKDAIYPFDGRKARISYRAIGGGDRIAVGQASVRIVETPGHTEGSVSYLLGEEVALTGDFLFIRSIGRPDLGGQVVTWTKILWQSLSRARSEWPPSIVICPAHYAEAAERNADRTVGRPLSCLVPENPPLQISDPEAFEGWILDRVGTYPDAYRRIKAINLGLENPSEEEMTELESGRNQCALG